MEINGLGSFFPDPLGIRREGSAEAASQAAERSAAETRSSAQPSATEAQGRAIDRVDPQLWSVLSGEEIAWYMRSGLSGPATYGPGSDALDSNGPVARLGQRLDVRI